MKGLNHGDGNVARRRRLALRPDGKARKSASYVQTPHLLSLGDTVSPCRPGLRLSGQQAAKLVQNRVGIHLAAGDAEEAVQMDTIRDGGSIAT